MCTFIQEMNLNLYIHKVLFTNYMGMYVQN